MPARIVLVVLLIAGIYLLLRWLARTPPAKIARVLKRTAIMAGVALLVLLAVTGRMHWLFAAIGTGAIALQRLMTVWQVGAVLRRVLGMAQAQRTGGGPSSGQRSTIETRFLRMSLDHDTGAMSGAVVEGAYRGRNLDELTLEQLMALLTECRAVDAQSAAVLEAYLDRHHGDDWRSAQGPEGEQAKTAPPAEGPMSKEEACAILGLTPGATEEEIRAAHRRLMQKIHPDRGGSDYLAAKINQAKDVLVGK